MKAFLLILCLCLPSSAAVKITSPYTSVTNFVKLVIHSHSTNASPTPDPGGNKSLAEVMRHYGDTNGFGAVIQTEHDALVTDRIPPWSSALLICGQEVTRSNHTVLMGVTNLVAGGYTHEGDNTPQGVINDAKLQNAIVGLAHPNYVSARWTNPVVAGLTNWDYVEVWNSVVDLVDGRSEGLAENFWDSSLYTGKRSYGYAGMDTHTALLTNAVNYVFLTETNEASVLQAIRDGNLVFGCNHNLRVTVTNETIYVHTYGVTSTIDWIKYGGVLFRTTTSSASDSYTCLGDEGYVRVRVTASSSTNQFALSQPLWVDNAPGSAANSFRLFLK